MKQSKVQDSLLTEDSWSYETQESDTIQPVRTNLFTFGSSMLAVIYMANTMVIPNMNQLQTEIDFSSTDKLIYSVICYWVMMTLILIPCYLVIKVCWDHSNPIFANIIQNQSVPLYKMFILANITVNVLGLNFIICRFGDSIIKAIPIVYTTYTDAKESGTYYFYLAYAAYTVYMLAIYFIIYMISYFEHYYEIQYRLLITFIGKWIISLAIFLLIIFQDECKTTYLPPDDNLLSNGYSFRSLMTYFFNILSCISYPFFEVFYVKRETKSGYQKVRNCYLFQLLLRLFYFFYQVLTWGLIYHHQALDCFYQAPIQGLYSFLVLLVAISIGPIYAHNYTLNMELYKGNIYTATKQDNVQHFRQIYMNAACIFLLFTTVLMICSIFMTDHNQVMEMQMNLAYSIYTFCFGFACIAMPIYIYIKTNTKRGEKSSNYLAIGSMGLVVAVTLSVCASPLY